MKSFVRKLCAGLVCACGMSVSVYATDYYVATDGNDMNVGSIEKRLSRNLVGIRI